MATSVDAGRPEAVKGEADAHDDVRDLPLFQPRPGGPAERFNGFIGDRHPVVAFLVALVSGYLLLAIASIALGFLVTDVLLANDDVERFDERFPSWLAGERTDTWTDVSWVGSEIAGGYVIPAVIALVAVVMAVKRRWRIAAYVLFAVAVESATYRATTLFVERTRPDVERLESLPGRGELSVGPHGGVDRALLRALRCSSPRGSRAAIGGSLIWVVALAIPPFVALSRIYRGMHHPIDALAGVPIGIAALVVVVFACRVAGRGGCPPRGRGRSRREKGRSRRARREIDRGRASRAPARPRGRGTYGSALVRGAEEPQGAQAGGARARRGGRARLRVGRRRHGAALPRRHGRVAGHRSRSCRRGPPTSSPRTSGSPPT